ncbi:MAG: methyltransferase domain-containing protein [Euryarchaeota archaeon]|nr:methyltransferase domain-containing protein [Euryarchaeota archaeon]
MPGPIGRGKGPLKDPGIRTFGIVSAKKGPITTVAKAYGDDVFAMINSRRPLELEAGEWLWMAVLPHTEEMGDVPTMTVTEMGSGHGLLDVTFESDTGPLKRVDIDMDDRGRARNLKRGDEYIVRVSGREGFFDFPGRVRGKKKEPDKLGKKRMEAFRELAGVKRGERILDAATGIRDYLRSFARRGADLTLAHISPAVLAETRAWLGSKDARTVRYDIEKESPFDDGAYDLVICDALLEYIRNPVHALEKLARALKPGGRLLLLEPVQPMAPVEDFYPQDLWELALWRPLKDPEFNPGNIEAALKDMGLAYQDMRAVEFRYPIWGDEGWVQSVALFSKR